MDSLGQRRRIPATTCACGRPISTTGNRKPRDVCGVCRGRERDLRLMRALYDAAAGAPLRYADAVEIGRRYGRDAAYLDRLLRALFEDVGLDVDTTPAEDAEELFARLPSLPVDQAAEEIERFLERLDASRRALARSHRRQKGAR